MLYLLSPAKTLDFERPAHGPAPTSPAFADRAAELIAVLRERSPAQVAELMQLSDTLAVLNTGRYGAWRRRHTAHNSQPAVFAFNGPVYGGIDARSLDDEALAWAQKHLLILSGLYGVLRPLDRIQPYRLEMGTRLPTPGHKDLYTFWNPALTEHLNARQARQRDPVLVDLASEEYGKAVDDRRLRARRIRCVFQEADGSAWRVVGIHAKRARGLMARHAVQGRIDRPEGLKDFAAEGYRYEASASDAQRLVFRRRVKAD